MIEKGLFKSVKHMALATVNEDGSPHNTPLFFAVDEKLEHIYFVSRDVSLHSVNFVRKGEGFVVIYDSGEFKGGLYITIKNGRKLLGDEKELAFIVYDRACRNWDIDVLPKDYQSSDDGYNLYAGDILRIEVYRAEEDSDGKIKEETRVEVKAQELFGD